MYISTRIFQHFAPQILSPAGGTWCLWRVLGPSGTYPVGLGPMTTSNLVSHGHIKWGPFFEFFRSDVCSQSYEVKHASSPHAFGRCVGARVGSAKITEYTLDRSEQLSFSCPPPNNALFKRYYARARLCASRAHPGTQGAQIFFGACLIP